MAVIVATFGGREECVVALVCVVCRTVRKSKSSGMLCNESVPRMTSKCAGKSQWSKGTVNLMGGLWSIAIVAVD